MQMKNIHYQNGLHLIKNNNVSDAVKELKLCLKFNENDKDALNLLGLAYYLKCRFDKAESNWRKSLSISRENNKAADYIELITKSDFKELRRRYKKLIFNDEAEEKTKIAFLENIITEHEELIEPYVILAMLYKNRGNREQALAYLYDAYDLDSGNKNIKEHILECESKKQSKGFFSFDFFEDKKRQSALILIFLLLFTIILLFNTNVFNSFQKEALQTDKDLIATSQNSEFITLDSLEQKNRDTKEDQSAAGNTKAAEQSQPEEVFQNAENNLLKNEELLASVFNNENILLTYSELEEMQEREKRNEELNQFKSELEAGNDQRLFEDGLADFRDGSYKEAALIFEAIYNLGSADYLKRESLYLLARSLERLEDYSRAEYYYSRYLDRYPESNYYEVVLYNLGLMYDQIGRSEASREVLLRLREEKPYSQYNNSRVYEILRENADAADGS